MAHALKKQMTLEQATRSGNRLGWRRNPATVAQDITKGVVEIIDGDTIFCLRHPIDLAVRRDGPHFLIAYKPLSIEEHGKTEKEALDAFAYHFGALWEGIAQADDRKLTKGAIQLKKEIRSLVKAVQPARS